MGTGTPEGLRIAICSPDGFGPGHMQRICSIGWEIYCIRAEASILTFPYSQFGGFLPISTHHDYIKLSLIAIDSPGNQTQSAANGNRFPVTPGYAKSVLNDRS
jgi:hypothetical protein